MSDDPRTTILRELADFAEGYSDARCCWSWWDDEGVSEAQRANMDRAARLAVLQLRALADGRLTLLPSDDPRLAPPPPGAARPAEPPRPIHPLSGRRAEVRAFLATGRWPAWARTS